MSALRLPFDLCTKAEQLGNQVRQDAILKHSLENYFTRFEKLFTDVIRNKHNTYSPNRATS